LVRIFISRFTRIKCDNALSYFFIKVFEIKKHIIVVILQALSVVTSYLSFGLFAHISPFGKQNIVFGIFGYLFALIGM